MLHESPHRFYHVCAGGLVHIMDSVPHLNISMCYAVKADNAAVARIDAVATCLTCLVRMWSFERMVAHAFAEGKKGVAY